MERRPRLIIDCASEVNANTLLLIHLDAMQFKYTLEWLLREILLVDPRYCKIYLVKFDLLDGFYRLELAPSDISKLGVILLKFKNTEELIAFPLTLSIE